MNFKIDFIIDITVNSEESIFKNKIFKEHIDIEKLKRVINSDKLKEDIYNDDNILSKYYRNEREYLKKILSINNDNIINVEYRKSIKMKYGRVYPKKGLSLCSMRKEIRHYLCKGIYVDIDIKNAHYTILNEILKSNNYNYEYIDEYVKNRDEKIKYYSSYFRVSEEKIKDLFIRLLNKGSIMRWLEDNSVNNSLIDEYIRGLIEDIDKIIKELKEKNKRLLKSLEKIKNKNENIDGSFIALYCQEYERRILERIYLYLEEQYKIKNRCVLCFDGIMILEKDYNEKMLLEIEEEIKNEEGFNIKLKKKEMYSNLFEEETNNELKKEELIDEEIKKVNIKEEEISNGFDNDYFHKLETYDEKKKYIELFVSKILHPEPVYIVKYYKYSDDTSENKSLYYSFYSKKNLFDGFGELKYLDRTDNKIKSFIERWEKDENKKKYEYMDFIPVNIGESKMNNNKKVFNLFRGYNNIIYSPFIKEDKEKNLRLFNKIGIELCSGNEEYYKYLKNFFADMIQNPNNKIPISIIIKGNQGTGKNMWLSCICNLLNKQNYICSAEPLDFFDKHAEGFNNKILININECEGKKTFDYEGKLKSIISEEYITINPKNLRPYQIRNIARLIIFTNKSTPIPIDIRTGDRRYVVFESTDYFLNKNIYNDDFWRKTIQHFKSPLFLASLYDELNGIDLNNFSFVKERPITEAYKKMIKNFIPNECLFFEEYINNSDYLKSIINIIDIEDKDKYINEYINIKGSNIYESYINFLKTTGLYRDSKDFKPSTKTFYLKIEEMRFPITKRIIHNYTEIKFKPIEIMKYLIKKNWILNDYSTDERYKEIDDENINEIKYEVFF